MHTDAVRAAVAPATRRDRGRYAGPTRARGPHVSDQDGTTRESDEIEVESQPAQHGVEVNPDDADGAGDGDE